MSIFYSWVFSVDSSEIHQEVQLNDTHRTPTNSYRHKVIWLDYSSCGTGTWKNESTQKAVLYISQDIKIQKKKPLKTEKKLLFL